jgi:hypothetical protein
LLPDGVDDLMHIVAAIPQHGVSRASLDGLGNLLGVLPHLGDQRAVLGVDEEIGQQSEDREGNGRDREDELKTDS